MLNNTEGSVNTATGLNTLLSNTTGSANTANGLNALLNNTTGGSNTATGSNALLNNTEGSANTATGLNALSSNTTGGSNTAIGSNALSTNTEGSANTALGFGANVASGNLNNATAIGANAIVDADNKIQLGDAAVTNVSTNGTLTAGVVTYPNTDGTAGQVLSTDGSGTLSWVNSTSSPCGLAIGQTYQGGIIFYLDASGCHGLICAANDQSTFLNWDNGSYTNTTAFASCVGCGYGNTSMIVYNQGSSVSYAARLCFELSLGGESDWYLPSIYELNLMYLNIGNGNALGLGNVGGFANENYWSSTEYNASLAWTKSLSDGSQYSGNKIFSFYVRAVRAF